MGWGFGSRRPVGLLQQQVVVLQHWKPSNLIPVYMGELGAAGRLTYNAVSFAISGLSDAGGKKMAPWHYFMFIRTKLCYVCIRSNTVSVGTELMPNCAGAPGALNRLPGKSGDSFSHHYYYYSFSGGEGPLR